MTTTYNSWPGLKLLGEAIIKMPKKEEMIENRTAQSNLTGNNYAIPEIPSEYFKCVENLKIFFE